MSPRRRRSLPRQRPPRRGHDHAGAGTTSRSGDGARRAARLPPVRAACRRAVSPRPSRIRAVGRQARACPVRGGGGSLPAGDRLPLRSLRLVPARYRDGPARPCQRGDRRARSLCPGRAWLRAAEARIEAVALPAAARWNPRAGSRVRRMLATRYPRTRVYRSVRLMLKDHPPHDVSALGIHPQPDRSRGFRTAAAATYVTGMVLMVVLAALPWLVVADGLEEVVAAARGVLRRGLAGRARVSGRHALEAADAQPWRRRLTPPTPLTTRLRWPGSAVT